MGSAKKAKTARWSVSVPASAAACREAGRNDCPGMLLASDCFLGDNVPGPGQFSNRACRPGDKLRSDTCEGLVESAGSSWSCRRFGRYGSTQHACSDDTSLPVEKFGAYLDIGRQTGRQLKLADIESQLIVAGDAVQRAAYAGKQAGILERTR